MKTEITPLPDQIKRERLLFDALENRLLQTLAASYGTLFEDDSDTVQIAIDLAFGDKGFYWDKGVGRYRDKSTGRLVGEKRILNLGEKYTEQVVKPRINRLTERFIDGDLTLPDWQQRVQKELKDGWTIQSVIGRGGIKQMLPADWGRLGGRLNFEYRRLATFAQEIASGNLTPGQIKFRIGLYVNATRMGFYDGKTSGKRDAGFTEERRRLNPAEHCPDCVGYAAQGWQPIGSLPEPGEASQCQRNCKCNKEYR